MFQIHCRKALFGELSMREGTKSTKVSGIMAIVFANPKWQDTWGGEIIFFDDSGEATPAVNPVPGRVILFDSQASYRIALPQRICYQIQMLVVTEYRDQRKLGNSL